MTRWTGVVLALPGAGGDGMRSRLPAYLHPVAGRLVVWHTVSGLFAVDPPPSRVLVAADTELPPDLFHDVGGAVDVLPPVPDGALAHLAAELGPGAGDPFLAISGSAVFDAEALGPLVGADGARWLGGARSEAVAAWLPPDRIGQFLRLPQPLSTPNGLLADPQRLPGSFTGVVVDDRASLARAGAVVRDRLVAQLMRAGVTFLLPDSVMVDVDVRVGRDSIVYPGVVLEGQTTVGEETVIGPGCRVISSWVGSGVEMKGWNYIAHTSIRNRAILEPYVRRGFD